MQEKENAEIIAKKKTMNEMCIDLMNENSIYFNLLQELYNENKNVPLVKTPGRDIHHKIPKFYYKMNSLDVDNSDDNLVSLSKADHFLAHYYIWRGSNEKYCGKAAAPVNFLLRFVTKGLSTSNITDEDVLFIEKLMKNGAGNLTVKGTHWYNNGEVCIMAKECPDGFVPGRINHTIYAELRLKKKEALRKKNSERISKQSTRVQKQKAKEYIDKELYTFPESIKNFALEMFPTISSKTICNIMKFLAENNEKDPEFFYKLEYTLLHLNEYDKRWEYQRKQLWKEKILLGIKEGAKKRLEQKQISYQEFLTENPGHSKFWYNVTAPKELKNYFKVTLKDSRHLLSLAYRNLKHNMGYHDFNSYFSLNKLIIIEELEQMNII